MMELLRRLFGRGRDVEALAQKLEQIESEHTTLKQDYEARQKTKLPLNAS